MAGWIAGAIVVGSIVSSNAASGAADTQAAGAAAAGDKSLEIANLQITAQKDALAAQLAADKANNEAQIAAAKDTLTQTLAAQKAASDAGNAAAASALSSQLAAQKAALDAQLNLQRELFNKQVENLRSYKEAGETGQTRLLELLGLGGNKNAPDFGSATEAFKVEGFDPNTLFDEFNAKEMEADPGYAFRVAEGQKALERSTAASRGLQSGAALKAATRYGQEMGSQEYQNAFNRSEAAANRFMANKAFQAQEFGNAFNRFTTDRANKLAPLQNLTASGQASAAMQSNAAGNFASGASQALQNYGSGQSAAYGDYGARTGDVAARTGAGTSAAYSNYGGNISNAYAGSNAVRQSAYSGYGSNLTNIYGQQGANQINAITGAANARAAGQIGSANAFTNALTQGISLYGMNQQNQLYQQYLNRLPPVGSDAAIKENICKIGVLDNGLNLYKFEYQAPYKDTWGHGEHIGVMAQEVEQIIPEAVSVHPDGYKLVNYSMIH